MPPEPTTFRRAASALFVYCAVFVLLSIDLLVRVWSVRAQFPRPGDVAAIFFFELSRSVVTAAAVSVGLWLTWRRAREPAMRALAVTLGFATLAFTKAAAFRAFPGRVQERLAEWLLAQDVPRALLTFLFGSPAWAAWLALAAFMLFAMRFPAPVTTAAIERSGARDRAGTLAGVGVAGVDVGALFRRAARALVRRDVLRPLPLGVAAGGCALVHHVLRDVPAANAVALLVAGAAAGIAITLLRAGSGDADDVARGRLAALRTGAIGASVLFLAAGAAGLLPAPLDFVGAALLAIAPAPALYGAARTAFTPDAGFAGPPR